MRLRDELLAAIAPTERKDHLEYFAARLRVFTRHLLVLQSGMTAKARRDASIARPGSP